MHNGLRLRPGLDGAGFDTPCARQSFIRLRSTCLREGILLTGLPCILPFESMLPLFFALGSGDWNSTLSGGSVQTCRLLP